MSAVMIVSFRDRRTERFACWPACAGTFSGFAEAGREFVLIGWIAASEFGSHYGRRLPVKSAGGAITGSIDAGQLSIRINDQWRMLLRDGRSGSPGPIDVEIRSITTKGIHLCPVRLSTPANIWREELRELGISAAELSRQIDVPVNRITGIIHGQPAVSPPIRRCVLGIGSAPVRSSAMNLQQLYELRLAESEIGEQIAAFALPRQSYQRHETLEKRHEPPRQETSAPERRRSPEGRASLSGLAGGAAAVEVASPGRQAGGAFCARAARAEARAVRRRSPKRSSPSRRRCRPKCRPWS